MEEVWNDINLSSLHQANNTNDNKPTFHFQDFFSDPKSLIDPPPLVTPNDTSSRGPASTNTTTFLSLGNGVSSSSSSSIGPSHCHSHSDGHRLNNKRRNRCDDHSETGDQRHKRLMKSRESADRSRARKQAYINDLEEKVANLRKENAKLKNQITQFYLRTAPIEDSRKPTLCRTLTAPF